MERGGRSNSRPKTRVPRSGAEERDMNGGQQGSSRDHDHHMPIASLTLIMYRVLPVNAEVADDCKEAIQECVSEFIGFITREANERCHRECRRTITPNDVISTMVALGFHNYVDPLTVYLNKHRARESNFHPPSTASPQPSVVPRPPLPPPPPMVGGYVPSPPVHITSDDDYVPELPQERNYYMLYRGNGEGSATGDMDQNFDPFN